MANLNEFEGHGQEKFDHYVFDWASKISVSSLLLFGF
jgi:hypothetical protein